MQHSLFDSITRFLEVTLEHTGNSNVSIKNTLNSFKTDEIRYFDETTKWLSKNDCLIRLINKINQLDTKIIISELNSSPKYLYDKLMLRKLGNLKKYKNELGLLELSQTKNLIQNDSLFEKQTEIGFRYLNEFKVLKDFVNIKNYFRKIYNEDKGTVSTSPYLYHGYVNELDYCILSDQIFTKIKMFFEQNLYKTEEISMFIRHLKPYINSFGSDVVKYLEDKNQFFPPESFNLEYQNTIDNIKQTQKYLSKHIDTYLKTLSNEIVSKKSDSIEKRQFKDIFTKENYFEYIMVLTKCEPALLSYDGTKFKFIGNKKTQRGVVGAWFKFLKSKGIIDVNINRDTLALVLSIEINEFSINGSSIDNESGTYTKTFEKQLNKLLDNIN